MQSVSSIENRQDARSLESELPNYIHGIPVKIDKEHIARHIKEEGIEKILGAGITKWDSVDDMFSDPEIIDFVSDSFKKINPSKKVQYFSHEFADPVGLNSVVPLSEIPDGCQVWKENREGFTVNVTDAAPDMTNKLIVRFSRRVSTGGETSHYTIVLDGFWAGNIGSPEGGLGNDEWKNYAFYDEVR